MADTNRVSHAQGGHGASPRFPIHRRVNATESFGEERALCSLSVALPIQSESCVVEYHRLGEGTRSDLRDNVSGEGNARAIIVMDALVTNVLQGRMSRDDALTDFMDVFAPVGAVLEDAERKLDATFPPAAALAAILKGGGSRRRIDTLSSGPALPLEQEL